MQFDHLLACRHRSSSQNLKELCIWFYICVSIVMYNCVELCWSMFNNLALKNRQVCPDYDQRVAGNSKQQNISADNLFLNALLCQYGYLHPVLQLK
jgi:hypothetical protein